MKSSSLLPHLLSVKPALIAATLALAPWPAEAGRNSGVPECPAPNGNQYMIRDFTNYSPRGARGTMNGKCEQSNVYRDELDEKRGGPMKHGACHYELEDHLSGKTNAVMGAVPLKGKASRLLGAIYKGVALDKAIGVSGTFIYVGDTYGKGWHTRECKMDIITKAVKSELTDKVNRGKGGELIKLARGDIPSSSRKVPRDPAALELMAPLAQNENFGAKNKFAATPKIGPVPESNPRQINGAQIPIPQPKPSTEEKSPGRWAGSTTEEIDAYYDSFSLNPKASPKTDRLKRKPASVPEGEERLKNFDQERFGE